MSREYADPNCPDCRGEGFIYGASMLDGGHSCHCMMDALKLQNMDKVWPSLAASKEIPNLRKKPPLGDLVKHSIWVTAKEAVFRAHLKAVAYTQSTMWDARVFTDLDLLDAWLKTAKAQGHKIYDSEVDNHEGRFVAMDVSELVESFGLVILKLGVKQAPNKETHSVILEALAVRRHLGLPTWIVDQPDQRIDDMSHRGYSELLEGLLSHWPHLGLSGPNVVQIAGSVPHKEPKLVSDLSADDILDVPEKAAGEIDDALSDLDDKKAPANEEEGDEEFEDDEEEENEDEGDGEVDPMIAALQANEERAAQKERYKPRSKKKSTWGRKK